MSMVEVANSFMARVSGLCGASPAGWWLSHTPRTANLAADALAKHARECMLAPSIFVCSPLSRTLWIQQGPSAPGSWVVTLDGSTVPLPGFSRGTSGAATLLWRLDLGSPATLVAVALSSTAWSMAVSAETAALQQALGLLCAPTTLSSVQPLIEGIFSVADVDP